MSVRARVCLFARARERVRVCHSLICAYLQIDQEPRALRSRSLRGTVLQHVARHVCRAANVSHAHPWRFVERLLIAACSFGWLTMSSGR